MLGIDAHIIDVLMPELVGRDQRPSAFLVYLYLWTWSRGTHAVVISHARLAEATGLSKSAAQSALAWLTARRLLRVRRTAPTAVPEYLVLRPWVRR